MNAQISKYKALLKTIDGTLNALNGERVSLLHIGNLKMQRHRFAGDPPGRNLIDLMLNHIDIYHNVADIRTLQASGEKVKAAMRLVAIAGQLSQGADR